MQFMNTLTAIETQQKARPKLDHAEPRGLHLEQVKVRDTISATLDGNKKVTIEILSSIELAPWLFHCLITLDGLRIGEEARTFHALYDSPIGTIFTEQSKHSIYLIETLLS